MISCFKGKFRLTSPRGDRVLNGVKGYHHGIDLVGLDDTTVYSIADGKVRTGSDNSAGNYVCVTIEDGRRVYYFHLKSFKVKTGDTVKKGQAVGIMGNTGHSFGAHTHLELRVKGTAYKSLDINEFTGIPNKVGVYTYTEEKAMKKRFTDIGGSIAENEIEELCDMGIVQGDGNAKFRPKDTISREEAALLVRRAVKYITGK